MLIVLQGWIWIGIPVQIDSEWIHPQPTGTASQKAVPTDAAEAATPLPFGLRSFDSRLLIRASFMPNAMPIAGAAAAAIWMAGIAIIVWRSICAFVALSRMVHALPGAKVEWQNELSALCAKQKM